MSLNPITKTANDVASYVKRQFGDESGTQMTDSDIWRWINSAQLEIIAQNQAIKAFATTAVVNGLESYDLSSLSAHQIESIHYNGYKLPGKTFSEAENYITTDVAFNETGTPEFWYLWGNLLYLWPVPNLDIVDGLKIYYTKMPTTVIDGTTALSLPDKYFEDICLWVMHKAYEMDEEFQQSNETLQRFTDRINGQSDEEYAAKHSTYQTITVVD